MKKGSKVKIVKEQLNRQQWMIDNNIYWGFSLRDGDYHMASLKVGEVYEVLKTRSVKGPSKGYIEVNCNINNHPVLVLREDVEEIKND